MFDIYDDTKQAYKFTFSETGFSTYKTKQELYEFYTLERHGLDHITFDEMVKELAAGKTIYAQDWQFDWGTGQHEYQGAIKITEYNPSPTYTSKVSNGCDHKDKYINSAGGVKFWYCRKCKQDLGDA